MTSKNLYSLVAAAVVLGGAAWYFSNDSKPRAARLNGKAVLPGFQAAEVTKIDIGNGKTVLASSADGWKVESLYGYPADRSKIAENLLKLTDLKVGQVARGRKLGETTLVKLSGADGKELATLKLGDKHSRKPTGQAAMYGGSYPDGRYLAYEDETVLVKDALDAFDGEASKWCDTRIASVPSAEVKSVKFTCDKESVELEKGTNSTWVLKGLKANEELDTSKTYSLDSALSYLNFTKVVDPKLDEGTLGFATGAVYTVTYKEGSNTVTKVAHVGNVAKGGSDRYFRLDDGKWIFTIPSYAAESMMKKRADLVKIKDPPKKEKTDKK